MPTLTSQSNHYVVNDYQQHKHSKNLSLLNRFFMLFTHNSQALSIKKGLKQAKDIQEGKVKAKSFEQAIAEL